MIAGFLTVSFVALFVSHCFPKKEENKIADSILTDEERNS